MGLSSPLEGAVHHLLIGGVIGLGVDFPFCPYITYYSMYFPSLLVALLPPMVVHCHSFGTIFLATLG